MRISFGGLTLDTDTRQLLRGCEEIPLSPKALDLLSLLLESRPRALSKAELQDRLWPKTYVSESNLAGLVAEIRRAIHDDPRTPRFVRTVHRFGYAFAGTVGADRTSSDRRAADSRLWLVHGKRQVPLLEGENILGREPEHGGFDSVTVSRRHARIVVKDAQAVLEDLGSKNGTSLRGRLIDSKQTLTDGDEIGLGSVTLTFRALSKGPSTRTWRRPRAS
jgi:DNA-binding winged helix-turn-helix (wHTH) protein